ncbi:hypothetical protein D3C71_994780 [compost metagenome]
MIVPSALIVTPAGAPTRLRITSAGGGGLTPLRRSLASTLVEELPPGTTLVSTSSPATRVPLLMLRVTVAVPQIDAYGAGRQVW